MRPTPLTALLGLLLASAAAAAQVPPAAPTAPTAPTAPSAPTAQTLPAPVTAAEVDRGAVIALGRFVSAWANMGSVDSLITRADPAAGTPEAVRAKLTSGLASFADQLGGETKVTSERVMIVNGQVQYWRTAEYSAVPVPLVFRVMVGKGGTWRGFTVTPEEQLPVGAEEVKQP